MRSHVRKIKPANAWSLRQPNQGLVAASLCLPNRGGKELSRLTRVGDYESLELKGQLGSSDGSRLTPFRNDRGVSRFLEKAC
jgi:hypothetical protein